MEVLSRYFLGLPYKTNPLIGSAFDSEVFTVSLDEFDCVTYVETILALALSSRVDEFVRWLRRIRYEGGRVDWKRRNHYMSEWIRNNTRLGALRRIAAPVHRVSKKRLLNAVPGLRPVNARFECVPKRSLGRMSARLKTGDLIFFASTRPRLDIFHCGIIVRDGQRLRMRHAARSRNGVVEQDLDEFLTNNRMAGVIVARPTAWGDRLAERRSRSDVPKRSGRVGPALIT